MRLTQPKVRANFNKPLLTVVTPAPPADPKDRLNPATKPCARSWLFVSVIFLTKVLLVGAGYRLRSMRIVRLDQHAQLAPKR